MILKIDRLAIELPMPEDPDPDAAAAVQELLGGRFGEMSTVMNYTFQSAGRRKALRVPIRHRSRASEFPATSSPSFRISPGG